MSRKFRRNLFIAEGALLIVLVIVLVVVLNRSGENKSRTGEGSNYSEDSGSRTGESGNNSEESGSRTGEGSNNSEKSGSRTGEGGNNSEKSGSHSEESGVESTKAGRDYIAAESAKDPSAALAAIREAKEAATGSEGTSGESDSSEGSESSESSGISADFDDLAEQIATLNIRELSPEELAMWQQRYESTVVVGDSMTQAILEYGLLDENHVKYQRSASISQLYELTEEALAMLPERIIFFMGLNDVDVFENPEDYYNACLERLLQVQAYDPSIKVCFCSLLPPSDDLAAEREDLARSPLYDTQLQQLCNDTSAEYIDTNWMVRQELYLEDGIHFNYDFYTIWLQYAA